MKPQIGEIWYWDSITEQTLVVISKDEEYECAWYCFSLEDQTIHSWVWGPDYNENWRKLA